MALLALGPLPPERSADADRRFADPDVVKRYEMIMRSIETPITDEEARALVRLFGIIASGSHGRSYISLRQRRGWPIEECLQDTSNEWVRDLKRRVENAARLRDQR
jgi:hypothetical protein